MLKKQNQGHDFPVSLDSLPSANERTAASDRLRDLTRYYELMDLLAQRTGSAPLLATCTGQQDWPQRGVYFFFEEGEHRCESGMGPRVVRVGTHALKTGSRSTLWHRVSQHRGPVTSGLGNHRGSIFRLLVGLAIMEREGVAQATWGVGSSAPAEVRLREADLERRASARLGRMSVTCIEVDDDARPDSERGIIEQNAIALLSNFGKAPLDRPSPDWLGWHCTRELVRHSGLWNQNHVREAYDPKFLDLLEARILAMRWTTR